MFERREATTNEDYVQSLQELGICLPRRVYSSTALSGTVPWKKPFWGMGLGEETTPQKSMPVTNAAAGQVMSQPPKMMATSFQFTALVVPLQRPTAMVAPEMQCVVRG